MYVNSKIVIVLYGGSPSDFSFGYKGILYAEKEDSFPDSEFQSQYF